LQYCNDGVAQQFRMMWWEKIDDIMRLNIDSIPQRDWPTDGQTERHSKIYINKNFRGDKI